MPGQREARLLVQHGRATGTDIIREGQSLSKVAGNAHPTLSSLLEAGECVDNVAIVVHVSRAPKADEGWHNKALVQHLALIVLAPHICCSYV